MDEVVGNQLNSLQELVLKDKNNFFAVFGLVLHWRVLPGSFCCLAFFFVIANNLTHHDILSCSVFINRTGYMYHKVVNRDQYMWLAMQPVGSYAARNRSILQRFLILIDYVLSEIIIVFLSNKCRRNGS